MSCNTSFMQIKCIKADEDNQNIIFSGLGADFDEVLELLVKASVKTRTFLSVLC